MEYPRGGIMTHNLLPCPFCGDEPTLRKSGARNNSQYMAMCARGCGACNGWKDTPEAANAAWNRRVGYVISPEDMKRIDEECGRRSLGAEYGYYDHGYAEALEWVLALIKGEGDGI